jgi:hypothetical protein
MTDFEFDQQQKPGTNRIIRHNRCETCDGHRMIQTSQDPEEWARCTSCNQADREPVDAGPRGRWWEE